MASSSYFATALKYLSLARDQLQALWQHPIVKKVFDASNNAYSRSEKVARAYIVRKLDLDSYMQTQGKAVLLNSLTDEDLDKLRHSLEHGLSKTKTRKRKVNKAE